MPAHRSADVRIFAAAALLPSGWASDVALTIGADGRFTGIEPGASRQPGDLVANGPVVPPLPNVHSHAFQRVMAGLAEVSGTGDDSFWTWRDQMYRIVGLLTPEDVEIVATRLYVDMLKAGYGRVGEFHYVHRDKAGQSFADPREMSLRILAAAETSGIGLTLLPTFYAHADFGGRAPTAGQARFIHSVDEFLRLMEGLAPETKRAGATLGFALHSLRAVTPAEMAAILAATPGEGPIHIHVAEQMREVEASIAATGRRPIDFLFDNASVDANWCLIHATHANDNELDLIARSGAVVGLCPSTEASLGDGIFPATDFRGRNGRFAIGSDSQVCLSPAEELRTLELGQRLRDQRRVRLVDGPSRSNGAYLFNTALKGGAQALGQKAIGLTAGGPADLVVLDGDDAFIAAASGDAILDRWLFALGDRAVRDVMIGGRWCIRDRQHEADTQIDLAFRRVIGKLAGV